jgi:phosphoribosylanthranilate isomerase
VKIKICGITRSEDAEAAVAAGADLVGFIFVEGTPRALDAVRSKWICELDGVEKVGVFLDSPLEKVMRIRDLLGLDWIQLHGDEPDTFLDALGEKVIRRIKVEPEIDWERVARLSERCLPLFDPGAGDGVEWAWEVLRERPPGVRFGLAGGLIPGTVAEAVRVVRPSLVDVSSGVESEPGIKDHTKIRAFVDAVRSER